ncbi:hypothetical protein DD238_006153 [Peronospora effusa]|uniref:RanBP2-type domain-containing protein n=1 Tax=Peronospora effusa TaxID=542832 RepID=A0A3M6V943_9STRA|nr:hypothetical protein DD238_006153 [Peronospora effusa]
MSRISSVAHSNEAIVFSRIRPDPVSPPFCTSLFILLPMAGLGGMLSDGDWPCPNTSCSNVNFARRTVCNRCQTPRPEVIGGDKSKPKEGTDLRGPPGLFQSGDWTCITCGNINWERRSECNMCKSSKPGMPGLDEKRDGAGGGFNERQQRVASAKKEVGEDGYDDFGVRKKKVKASKAEREAAALARLQQSYRCATYTELMVIIVLTLFPGSSAIYQPPQSATDSSEMLVLSESKKVSDKSLVPAALPTSLNGGEKRRSRSPIPTSRVGDSSRSRGQSRERRRHSPSRVKRDRRERSPPGRGRDGRQRSRSRGCSNDRERDRSRRDRRYR